MAKRGQHGAKPGSSQGFARKSACFWCSQAWLSSTNRAQTDARSRGHPSAPRVFLFPFVPLPLNYGTSTAALTTPHATPLRSAPQNPLTFYQKKQLM